VELRRTVIKRKGLLMKKIFLIVVFACSGVSAQTQYYYGSQGESLGTAMQSGNTTYYYGAQGQSQGTATQSGNTTYYYGPQGQSQGQTINQVAPMPMQNTPSYNQPNIPPPPYRR
jgi:YD repeat-containing protein